MSVGLVRIVKSKHNKAHAAKKAAKSVETKVTADKPDVNKSEAIPDYYKANPKAKTSEVFEALGKAGITVSVSLVTTVKAKRRHHLMPQLLQAHGQSGADVLFVIDHENGETVRNLAQGGDSIAPCCDGAPPRLET